MGTGASRNPDSSSHGGEEREGENLDQAGGGQLYVSLKMVNYKLQAADDVLPHVYGSAPLVGSWDPSKAVIKQDFRSFLLLLSFQFSQFMILP